MLGCVLPNRWKANTSLATLARSTTLCSVALNWQPYFLLSKGSRPPPKQMNFRKNSKPPLTPPLIFGKSYCKFFPKFVTELSSIMAKICNINFWIENDPPPFGTFPKIHLFWMCQASLMDSVLAMWNWIHKYNVHFLMLSYVALFECVQNVNIN